MFERQQYQFFTDLGINETDAARVSGFCGGNNALRLTLREFGIRKGE